jgi:sigma-B regulation protein RsbU (phosphoserine phosphatase)
VLQRSEGPCAYVFKAFGLDVLCPIFKRGRVIAALGLGPRAGGRSYGPEECGFLRSVAACAATPIENGLIYHELRDLNQRLSVKVFQLNNLFDISRELTSSFDEDTIQNLVATTLMGHLMVSRCALYLRVPDGFAVAYERGVKKVGDSPFVSDRAVAPLVEDLRTATPLARLPNCPFKERLLEMRMALVVPMGPSGRVEGLLAVGERVSGAPFTDEDCDFAMTLGRQAQAALESVHLHRVQLAKQRQDREMQIAREIQQSLFPKELPRVKGFDLAAQSWSCYEVGGDHYDCIPLDDNRVALAIADVSGKGAPASLLMASVHASLRALAGTLEPGQLMLRLNRFLYDSTQANRYVTLFYAELEPASRRLTYVNGGHVPPYWIRKDGTSGRLSDGGPVLGLLEDATFEAGEIELARGDLLAIVTDGATEALSPDEVEFGDGGILDTLVSQGSAPARDVLEGLVGAVNSWTGSAGCSDDLTALVLRAL